MKYSYDLAGHSDEFYWDNEPECYKPIQQDYRDIMYDLVIATKTVIMKINEERENEKVLVMDSYFCKKFMNLDAVLDKVVAFTLCRVFEEKQIFNNMDELIQTCLEVMNEIRNEPSTCEDENIQCGLLVIDGEIDTTGLEIGMVVKNYKELCALLKQEVKGGKSKILQLEDFKRYFDYEKSGQKFIITDIFDVPLSKEDKRKLGNKSIYVKCIEVILLQYLSKQEGFTKTFTKRNWWELLGFVNHKYNRISAKELENLDYTVTPFEIKHFYQRCNKKLEQVLFSALNSLRERKLLIYDVQTVIVKSDSDAKKEKYSIASDDEKKKILQVERYILNSVMGYEKMIQVFCRFKQNEFYQSVNEKLYELYGWSHYFKQIKVIYTPEDIKDALPKMEIDLQKELLNKKIIDFLNANAEEIYKKKREKYDLDCKEHIEQWWGNGEDIIKPNNKLWKIPDTYITAQKILTDELVKIGHNNINFSEEEFMKSNKELDDLFAFVS